MGEDQELEKALAEFLASKEADAFAENNYNEPMRCMEHGFKVGWEQRSEISPFERFGRFLADDHDDEKSRKTVGEFQKLVRVGDLRSLCKGLNADDWVDLGSSLRSRPSEGDDDKEVMSRFLHEQRMDAAERRHQENTAKLVEALEGLTNAALAGLKPLPSQIESGFEALKKWEARFRSKEGG